MTKPSYIEPKKYRKKPVEVEAMQITDGRSLDDIYSWVIDNGGVCVVYQSESGRPVTKIQTLEGVMEGGYRDWIIRGVKGEFYPCKPDIFESTYAAVSAEDEKAGLVSLVFETAEELYNYAENGHFNGLALLREADGRAWIYFEGEDGPMCLRPWDEDEEALTNAKAGTHVVACFSEIDGFSYPVTVTVDYYAPEAPSV